MLHKNGLGQIYAFVPIRQNTQFFDFRFSVLAQEPPIWAFEPASYGRIFDSLVRNYSFGRRETVHSLWFPFNHKTLLAVSLGSILWHHIVLILFKLKLL